VGNFNEHTWGVSASAINLTLTAAKLLRRVDNV